MVIVELPLIVLAILSNTSIAKIFQSASSMKSNNSYHLTPLLLTGPTFIHYGKCSYSLYLFYLSHIAVLWADITNIKRIIVTFASSNCINLSRITICLSVWNDHIQLKENGYAPADINHTSFHSLWAVNFPIKSILNYANYKSCARIIIYHIAYSEIKY